jgi:hypothetical protein
VKRLLTVVPALALVVAACSSSSGTGGVASLDDSATTTTTSAQEGEVSVEDAMLAYAQCMRDQGIDMPDPTFDGQGGFGVQIQPGDPGTFDREQMDAAQQACQQYLADVQQGFDRPDQSETEDQLVAFAQCMRDEGIADFPDPDLSDFGPGTGGGPRVQTGEGGEATLSAGPFPGVDFSDPAVQAAAEACQGDFGGGFRIGFSGPPPGGSELAPGTGDTEPDDTGAGG